jgi:hypothetical protein
VTLTKLGPKLTARCLLPAPSYSVRVVHTNGHVRVGESGTCRALPLLDSSPIHPEARESMRWQGTDATGPPFPLNSTCARARRPISTTRTRHSSNDREESTRTCACARSQASRSRRECMLDRSPHASFSHVAVRRSLCLCDNDLSLWL